MAEHEEFDAVTGRRRSWRAAQRDQRERPASMLVALYGVLWGRVRVSGCCSMPTPAFIIHVPRILPMFDVIYLALFSREIPQSCTLGYTVVYSSVHKECGDPTISAGIPKQAMRGTDCWNS